QWGYSNHESDPAAAGGHDLNAFDLVRVHKFCNKDRADGYQDPTRAPSFKALVNELTADDDFMAVLDKRKADIAIGRFADI
ncbi:hypothetical protein ACP3WA_25880, partial [Salmonella enterica]|uniref:hypothetical protein n=1 Tax=Salmonella enterica TaxID=28901 RepID=UPI003CEE8C3D